MIYIAQSDNRCGTGNSVKEAIEDLEDYNGESRHISEYKIFVAKELLVEVEYIIKGEIPE
jgi:hypothetical protein